MPKIFEKRSDYVESCKNPKKDPLPENSCRGHVFPVAAFEGIIKRTKFGEKSGSGGKFLISKKTLIENGADENEVEIFHKFREEAHSSKEKVVKSIADAIPYIVIPRDLEEEINNNVKKYAISSSDTGSYSKKISKSSSAIYDESEFASQHPEVYLEIFGFLFENYVEKNYSDELEFAKSSLTDAKEDLKNLSERFVKICQASNEKFHDSIFGSDKTKLSRTYSGEREVLLKEPPSLDAFNKFIDSASEEIPVSSIKATKCQKFAQEIQKKGREF